MQTHSLPVISLLLACTLSLSACRQSFTCSTQTAPLPEANAGCFVARDGKLLVAQQHTGLWNLPGGTAEAGEAAQCTAERETWEETGVRVEAGELLRVFDNGFHLFRCRAADNTAAPQPPDGAEVRAAQWLQGGELADYRWRFPEQLADMQRLLRDQP